MILLSWFCRFCAAASPSIRSVKSPVSVRFLARHPISEMAVRQRVERAATLAVGAGQAVVVDQRMESVAASVPDVPDEGTLMKTLTVLFEEAITQPSLDGIVRIAVPGRSDQELPLHRC